MLRAIRPLRIHWCRNILSITTVRSMSERNSKVASSRDTTAAATTVSATFRYMLMMVAMVLQMMMVMMMKNALATSLRVLP